MIKFVKEREYYKICDFDEDEDRVVNEIKITESELNDIKIELLKEFLFEVKMLDDYFGVKMMYDYISG